MYSSIIRVINYPTSTVLYSYCTVALHSRAVFVTDVTVLELEVRGESLPFSVALDPPALLLQSAAFAGVTTKRQVTVRLVTYIHTYINFTYILVHSINSSVFTVQYSVLNA